MGGGGLVSPWSLPRPLPHPSLHPAPSSTCCLCPAPRPAESLSLPSCTLRPFRSMLHRFVQQIFTGYLLCARTCSRPWLGNREPTGTKFPELKASFGRQTERPQPARQRVARGRQEHRAGHEEQQVTAVWGAVGGGGTGKRSGPSARSPGSWDAGRS